jgi:site-specific recombinase XerD
MLFKCPECELSISDKALFCPHCGYVLQKDKIKSKLAAKKRKKLPNGFGQITEIKNKNLRKPFRVLITVGKNEFGRPICKPLKPQSFFETYNEAYSALLEYNKKPFDLKRNITMEEMYEEWVESYKTRVAYNTYRNSVVVPWKYCSYVYNIPVRELRSSHIKYCIENGSIIKNDKIMYANIVLKNKIKVLFNMLLDYAIECDLTDRNYSRMLKITSSEKYEVQKSHICFTDDEMDSLWNNVDIIEGVDIILIQCYSGWRPQELLNIKIIDVDLDVGFFKGGLKTKSGKNRIVPIHEKIKDLVKNQLDYAFETGSEYLINVRHKNSSGNHKLNYTGYTKRLSNIINELGLNRYHRPHDPRVQFVTMAKRDKVDEYAIKKIIGHKINDLTESVYTHRDFNWLKEEINKIK